METGPVLDAGGGTGGGLGQAARPWGVAAEPGVGEGPNCQRPEGSHQGWINPEKRQGVRVSDPQEVPLQRGLLIQAQQRLLVAEQLVR